MDLRPGIKTSEFWLSLLVTILGALQLAGVFGDATMIGKMIGAALMAFAQFGYNFGRAKVKAAAPPVVSATIPDPRSLHNHLPEKPCTNQCPVFQHKLDEVLGRGGTK